MRILSAYFNQRTSVRIFHTFLYLFPLFVIVKLLLREPTRCDNNNHDNYSLVFVGGYPRSGTTLLRVMLDVHPMVRCGPETVVIPKMLYHLNLLQTGSERRRLVQAHLYPKAIYASFAAFIRSLIEHAGKPAPVLCNKDPFSLVHMKLLSELFPTAKFINMVRDGRAVVASVIKRKVKLTIRNYSYEEHMDRWANVTWKILEQCDVLGPATCRTVSYEKLVLRPRENMQAILEFLELPWDPVVLHHHSAMDETSLNIMEPSSSQVTYPVHMRALSSWAENTSALSSILVRAAHRHTRLLSRLGYAQLDFPPVYGVPEEEVTNNTELLRSDSAFVKLYL